jgi:hypothetical protein
MRIFWGRLGQVGVAPWRTCVTFENELVMEAIMMLSIITWAPEARGGGDDIIRACERSGQQGIHLR